MLVPVIFSKNNITNKSQKQEKRNIFLFRPGSDVASSTTNAVRRGDDLIINGQKMWITNAFQADWICLLANTSDGPGIKHNIRIRNYG